MIGTFMEIESCNISVYSPTKIDNYISFPHIPIYVIILSIH